MYTTSISLLERLRQPDQQVAWERFVRLYTPLICNWTRGKGLREHDGEDLVQDVFALLAKKLPEFAYDADKSFRGWLRTIVLNCWRSRIRKEALEPRAASDALLTDVAAPADGAAFEEIEYRQYLVGRALRLMKTDFETITWRSCWEHRILGRPAKDVAAELGIKESQVFVNASKVMRRLRDELRGLLD